MGDEFLFYEGTANRIGTFGMIAVIVTVGFDAGGPAKWIVRQLVTLISGWKV